MKKEFTPDYIRKERGCYTIEKVNECSFMGKKSIGIIDILKSEIPLKDKGWFLTKKCELTIEQKKNLAYDLAMIVLPIYELKHPGDLRVRACLKAIKLFREGKINRSELIGKRDAAYADAAAAAAYAAADAAAAAAYAAADAAAAADAYAAAYAAAAAAAYAAAAAKYSKQILKALLKFVKNN